MPQEKKNEAKKKNLTTELAHEAAKVDLTLQSTAIDVKENKPSSPKKITKHE